MAERRAQVEAMLKGQHPSPDLFTEAGRLMSTLMVNETGRRWSTPYKERALAAMVEEALERVLPIAQHAARSEALERVGD